MSIDRMACMSCGQTKAYPDGFQSSAYADCWACVWRRHMHYQHPPTRRQRREMRKKAAAIAYRKMRDELDTAPPGINPERNQP